jgi:hypothetical protein
MWTGFIVARDKKSWRVFVSMAMNSLDKMRVISCLAVKLLASVCEPCFLEWDNRYMAKRTNLLYFCCAVAPILRFLAPFSHSFPNICSQTTSLCVRPSDGWPSFILSRRRRRITVLSVFLDTRTQSWGFHILIFRQVVMTKMHCGILQSLQTNIESEHQIIRYPIPFISFPVYFSLIRETFCTVQAEIVKSSWTKNENAYCLACDAVYIDRHVPCFGWMYYFHVSRILDAEAADSSKPLVLMYQTTRSHT